MKTTTFLAKYFYYLLINVGRSVNYKSMLQTNYLPYNTNAKGLRENFKKLCFIELSQNFCDWL